MIAQVFMSSVAAYVLQGCGDLTGPEGPRVAPPLSAPLVVTLANFPALAAVGGIARVDGGSGPPVAVARLGVADYSAFSMVCTHAGFSPIGIEAGGFECPNHGAQFAADGTWVGGQRTRNLLQYPLVLNEAAGTLTIG